MPSSRPRGSGAGAHSSPRVSSAPMSERQQMALVMQLTSQTAHHGTSNVSHTASKTRDRNERGETALHVAAIKGEQEQVKKLIEQGVDPNVADFAENPSSHRIPHTGKLRDDTKKNSTGEESATSSSYSTDIMDSSSKSSDEKNETKETTTNADKSVNNPIVVKNEVISSSTSHEETPMPQTQGSKRAFVDTSETAENESLEDEGSKRKKRKDSDSSKESTKSTQQTRVSVGRNNLVSSCKPPGPASKTGVAPLSKGNTTPQGSSSKSSNTATQGKSGSGAHGQGNQSKNSNTSCKSTIGGGQHTSQSSKTGSGNQGKSQTTNSAISQTNKNVSDKKSPCASPKPATFNQVKEEPEVEEKTIDTPGPKVPPLKIVIPGGVGGGGGSGSQQEGECGSTQRGNTKNRGGNSTLPYILQPSNSVTDNVSSNSEGNDNNSEIKEEKRQGNSSDEKSGSSGQRVLRSHRNADGIEKDKDRGRNSPHISQSSINSPSGNSASTKTPAHQSGDNNDSNSNSSNTSASSSSASTSGSSSSGGNASTSGNSQIVWDGVFQVPSVDFHPRKRKIKSSKESHSHHQSSAPDSSSHASTSSGDSHATHINPQSNSYQMYINVKKQIERRQKSLFPVQPKPPQGFKDYLMNRCSYVLKSNAKQQKIVKPPASLPPQMREEFILQENERHYLRVQHLVEKEKLVLAVEQEILRVHGRAARALANQSLPFSVCSVLRDKEVYNMLTPEQEEKERNAQRSRYNGRLFLSWLQDVDDKWEKIKESMVRRHHSEAQSLCASQTMNWNWRLQELGLCDRKSTPLVDQGHVPKVNVSDDFDLLPA